MPSIMERKTKIFSSVIFLALLLICWEIAASVIDLSFVVPHPIPTFGVFFKLLTTASFWSIVAMTLIRIFLGLFLGIICGSLIAILSVRFRILQGGIQSLMGIVKATPVASFILVLWVIIGRDTVPAAIALLMVTPIVYHNLFSGYNDLEKEKRELLSVFGVPFFTRVRIFILPQLMKYMFPAVITATGLAWKAGIAAEIIAYTQNSIGREISNAKNYLEGELLFAWTIAVILLSLLFEYGLKGLERKVLSVGRNPKSEQIL